MVRYTHFLVTAIIASGAVFVQNLLDVQWIYSSYCHRFSVVVGVLMALLPIGGADMPVVISLLNRSYSGLVACAAGCFAVGNNIMIVAGSLVGVGASGIIRTQIMCSKVMNRSVSSNVLLLFSGFRAVIKSSDMVIVEGEVEPPLTLDDAFYVLVEAASSAPVAIIPGCGMAIASSAPVAIIPGCGMAVAQAQAFLKS